MKKVTQFLLKFISKICSARLVLEMFVSVAIFTLPCKVMARDMSMLLVDLDTKKIIYESNATEQRFPASLTKLMVLYIAFDKIQQGKIGLDDIVVVSKNAAKQPSSQIYLQQGDEISVYDLISSIIVQSANDSAVALAEYIGGTEQNFVDEMNNAALKLKMYFTYFVNANGLHDDRQVSTAKDIARLSVSLYNDFKDFYPLFSMKTFAYKGRNFTTHNSIVAEYSGANGLKTGYVAASGYNIASTAQRNGNNVLTVVLGGRTAEERNIYASELLDYGFDFLSGRIQSEYSIFASN